MPLTLFAAMLAPCPERQNDIPWLQSFLLINAVTCET